MRADRWALTVQALLGQPMPPLPALPGRVHECIDSPLPDDEIAAIDDPRELALCAGIGVKAATERLQQRDPGAVGASQTASHQETGWEIDPSRYSGKADPICQPGRARVRARSVGADGEVSAQKRGDDTRADERPSMGTGGAPCGRNPDALSRPAAPAPTGFFPGGKERAPETQFLRRNRDVAKPTLKPTSKRPNR